MGIAFSVSGVNHTSSGNPDVLGFEKTELNERDGWQPPSQFKVPDKGGGLYCFTITFAKDGHLGTNKTVRVALQKGNEVVVSAYSGVSTKGSVESAVASTAVMLQEGDVLHTVVSSQDGEERCLAEYRLTGFRFSTQ